MSVFVPEVVKLDERCLWRWSLGLDLAEILLSDSLKVVGIELLLSLSVVWDDFRRVLGLLIDPILWDGVTAAINNE